MPMDEARKLVEELTGRLEDVFSLNRQRARLVDILISASAEDMAETEKELERTNDDLFRSESEMKVMRWNEIEKALRDMKRDLQKDGLFKELKQRRSHEKPSVKKEAQADGSRRTEKRSAEIQETRTGLRSFLFSKFI